VFADTVDPHDVGMAELRDALGFPEESELAAIGGVLGVEDQLDCADAVQTHLECLVDDAHAAAPEFLEDLETVDLREPSSLCMLMQATVDLRPNPGWIGDGGPRILGGQPCGEAVDDPVQLDAVVFDRSSCSQDGRDRFVAQDLEGPPAVGACFDVILDGLDARGVLARKLLREQHSQGVGRGADRHRSSR
jgi:hypothetical protein